MSDESAESATTGGTPHNGPPIAQRPQDAAKQAYGLFVRGMDVEAIAEQVGAQADVVAAWVGDWAVRNTEDGDPKRAVAGDALRAVLRTLFANIAVADVNAKPKYATAIAQIEAKLVQLDGRCGAKVGGGYCQEYPARGRTRCFLHGGSTLVGRLHPNYVSGQRSRFPFTDAALAAKAEEIRSGDVFEGMLDNIATATVVYQQSVREGRSGVAELRALNDAITRYADITKGKKIVHVPDEATARALLGAIYGCLKRAVVEKLGEDGARPVLMLAAQYVHELDWSKVDVPALPAPSASSPT